MLISVGLLLSLLTVTCHGEDTEDMVDIYCGDRNCYEVLGVTRDSSKKEISKAYRRLAQKWHPDMFRSAEDKEVAEKKFMQIATAYETLRDDESRADYDYMLEHPEEMWRNYYRYYRRRVGPKVDVRLVLAVTISLISAGQYYFGWNNYNEAIKCLSQVPKYRIQATEIAKTEGLLKKDKKADRGKSKEELREEEENVIRTIIANKMDIKGGYAPPHWSEVLWVQLVILPYTLYRWAAFYLRWLWKFGIKREEYGEEEKRYVIRKNLGISVGQFSQMEEDQLEEMMELELWVKEKFKVWKAEKDAEQRIKMAQSGRYKQYRRYMKSHANDRMTFED